MGFLVMGCLVMGRLVMGRFVCEPLSFANFFVCEDIRLNSALLSHVRVDTYSIECIL